jgi:hypothetical protein
MAVKKRENILTIKLRENTVPEKKWQDKCGEDGKKEWRKRSIE